MTRMNNAYIEWQDNKKTTIKGWCIGGSDVECSGLNVEPIAPESPSYVKFLEAKKKVDHLYLWSAVKSQRDSLLKESDWTATPDANPKPSKEAWLAYRQALRDLPQNFENPEEVIWPEKPE